MNATVYYIEFLFITLTENEIAERQTMQDNAVDMITGADQAGGLRIANDHA